MSPTPTAEWSSDEPGALAFRRSFEAPIDDVWASITESERTARWFASWSGEAGPGRTIRYRLEHEEGTPEADMTIEVCDPPHRLVVSTADESGSWRLEARLRDSDGTTELLLLHHGADPASLGEIGPGWEYYLDALVASRSGATPPAFDDYYPTQRDHFLALVPPA